MKGKRSILCSVMIAFGVLAAILIFLAPSSQPARADLGTLCVAPGGIGCDVGVCGSACYASVQAAVDAALTGDEIRVAAGTYTGVQAQDGMTQTVLISKTVTLRGGYNSDLTDWDPEIYTTTLDAQGQGRVVSIVGSFITPTLEGFVITGGDATSITLNCPTILGVSDGCGGGVFVFQSSPIIVNNIVTNNVAGVSLGAHAANGGGLCLSYASGSVISGNQIISNTASLGARGAGGGLILNYPYGVMMSSNRVIENTATKHSTLAGSGGGIAITGSGAAATIQDNLIESNRTNGSGVGFGAAIYHWYGSSHIQSNQIVGNTGTHAVYLGGYEARFESNQVLDNHTSIGVVLENGGLSSPTLVNNIIARSGDESLSFSSYSGAPLTVTLIHNTLVGSGTGYGVFMETGYVNLALTNTIVASHTWGITNTYPTSSTVNADHTLFWVNTHDGIIGTNPIYGDPAFLDSGTKNYHLAPDSAAIDAGVLTAETLDIDSNPRPLGTAPDIGADEAAWREIFLPLVMRN